MRTYAHRVDGALAPSHSSIMVTTHASDGPRDLLVMRRLLADLRSQPVEKLVQAFRRFLPNVRALLARLQRRQAVIGLIREEPDIECPLQLVALAVLAEFGNRRPLDIRAPSVAQANDIPAAPVEIRVRVSPRSSITTGCRWCWRSRNLMTGCEGRLKWRSG
jgi:hypothetical protein